MSESIGLSYGALKENAGDFKLPAGPVALGKNRAVDLSLTSEEAQRMKRVAANQLNQIENGEDLTNDEAPSEGGGVSGVVDKVKDLFPPFLADNIKAIGGFAVTAIVVVLAGKLVFRVARGKKRATR